VTQNFISEFVVLANSNPLCLSPASSYGREYADPYLGHSIGPVAGYGVSIA
jgi:hypothetical protein